MLALAEAFVGRGHDVTWVAQPSVGGRARSAGCEFLPFEGIESYASRVELEQQLDLAGPLLVSPHIGDQVSQVATERTAALIVVDANLAASAAAAEGHEARSAILLHSMYATFTDVWMAELWPFLAPIVNDTRAHFGLAAADSWAEVFARHDRILSVVPERFDAQVAARPEAMRSWGFLVPTSHGTSTARWPAENPERLRVLVTLGTTYLAQERRLQDVLDALSDLDVAGIASTAGQVDIDDLRCPPNVEVHDFVDHASLLPECDLMITHAGLGERSRRHSATACRSFASRSGGINI